MNVAVTAFTRRGAALAEALAAAFRRDGDVVRIACPRRLAGELSVASYDSLTGWTGERFRDCDALLFVGACGIAVRAIAPHVKDKFTDPAVVAVDEGGAWAVPLLSGHVGGANELARRVAEHTGGAAAISTATDVNGVFAVDLWAKCKGLYLDGRTEARSLSSALLRGESCLLESDFPLQGEPFPGFGAGPWAAGMALSDRVRSPRLIPTVWLVPPTLTLGIGCRRGTPRAVIERVVANTLEAAGLHPRAVFQVSTIDRKQDEAGLLAFCEGWGLPLATWTPEELLAVPGSFTPSDFVRSVTGVDNVCERAAVRAGGTLIVPKQSAHGVTVAVARRTGTLSLDWEEGIVWD